VANVPDVADHHRQEIVVAARRRDFASVHVRDLDQIPPQVLAIVVTVLRQSLHQRDHTSRGIVYQEPVDELLFGHGKDDVRDVRLDFVFRFSHDVPPPSPPTIARDTAGVTNNAGIGGIPPIPAMPIVERKS